MGNLQDTTEQAARLGAWVGRLFYLPALAAQGIKKGAAAVAGAPAQAIGSLRSRMKARLIAQVGKPYVFGSEVALTCQDPDQFDCSELGQWFHAIEGVTVPDGAKYQFAACIPIPLDALDVCDPIFKSSPEKGIYHVGYYIGNGKLVEAKGKNYGVVVSSLSSWTEHAEAGGYEVTGGRFQAMI